jgi:hypothetical protein
MSWHTNYIALYEIAQQYRPEETVHGVHWGLMAGCLASSNIIAKRLLGAVSGIESRRTLEPQCQNMVEDVLQIQSKEIVMSAELKLALAQQVRIAEATRATSLEWVEESELKDMESGGQIDKWKFVHWCELFGRKTS